MQISGASHEGIGAITSLATLNKYFSPVLATAAPLFLTFLSICLSWQCESGRHQFIVNK